MQFNSHATGQDIVSLSNTLCRQSNTTFPLAAKTLHANAAGRLILGEIHDAYGGWRYDDRNQTDLPVATSNLVSGQSNYALPNDSVGLAAVFVQNENDSEWTKLDPLAFEEIPGAEPDFEDTDANPRYYRVLNNSLILYPASSYSKASALQIEYDRDISAFATTDTTKSPGFDPMFHEAIPCYVALQFAKTNQLPMKDELAADWENWLAKIRAHYARKWRDQYPARFKSRLPINDYL